MPYKSRKNWKKKAPVGKKPDRDTRFKQINPYKVKPEPFPRVLYTRCKFSDSRRLNGISSTLSVAHSYALNSIWDPDFSGTGRTVVGHSQLAAIYSRYLVTGAKIYVSFLNPGSPGQRVGCRLRVNTGLPAGNRTTQQLAEQPMTYMNGISESGSNKKNYSFFVRPWTLMGLSKLEYMANTTQYSSVMLGSPLGNPGTATAPGAFMDIFTVNPDTLVPGSNNTVDCVVRIVYYVQCYERKGLSSTAY